MTATLDIYLFIYVSVYNDIYIFFQLQLGDHGAGIKKYKIRQPTKKLGCPAQIVVREIVMFPKFKVRH